MSDWKYDVATQSIAGASPALLSALLFSSLSSGSRGAWSGNAAGSIPPTSSSARRSWLAVEAIRDFSKEVLKASQEARDALERDLLAIMAMSPAGGGGEASTEDRERWLSIGKRQSFEVLETLIAACKRTAS